MQIDPLTLSLDTVIAAAPMLGYKLEDRSRIRRGQDPSQLLLDAHQRRLALAARREVVALQGAQRATVGGVGLDDGLARTIAWYRDRRPVQSLAPSAPSA